MSSRSSHLLRTYGITEEEYEKLLDKQDRCCPICLKPETEFSKRMCVDHNHKTGEIRGLLCGYCNQRVVGRHTDYQMMYRVAGYLMGGTGLFVPPKKKRKKRGR